MKFAVMDVETSGLFDYSRRAHEDGQPRMASLALLRLGDDLSVADEFHTLIKPDGWQMDAEVAKINGLTQERLEAEGKPVAEALDAYGKALDEELVIVGWNVSFDLKILRGELRRAGREDRFESTKSTDCMRPLTDIVRIPKAKGSGFKLPKLTEAYCAIFNRDFEGAHSALADAKACAEIFREMHPKGVFKAVLEQR